MLRRLMDTNGTTGECQIFDIAINTEKRNKKFFTTLKLSVAFVSNEYLAFHVHLFAFYWQGGQLIKNNVEKKNEKHLKSRRFEALRHSPIFR